MTQVKICGITRMADALHAAACGADAVGFIFHPASPRYISPQRAREIVAALPAELVKVGVFVNQAEEEVRQTAVACGCDLIQLHGDESPGYCRRFPPERIIKAVFLRTPEDLRRLGAYAVRAFLADSREKGRYGGTGRLSDWGLAAKAAGEHLLILAGGLGPENIDKAIAAVAPASVDINSGCESSPGIKDHDRIRRIIAIVRERGVDRPPVFVRPMGGCGHPGEPRIRVRGK